MYKIIMEPEDKAWRKKIRTTWEVMRFLRSNPEMLKEGSVKAIYDDFMEIQIQRMKMNDLTKKREKKHEKKRENNDSYVNAIEKVMDLETQNGKPVKNFTNEDMLFFHYLYCSDFQLPH